MPLSAASFVVNQVDIDGGALKTIATATTATTPPPAAGGAALNQPDDAGLTTLRTAGLSLVQTGRADALQAEFSRSGTVNSAIVGGPTRLFAEDLVRGYRLDVRDDLTGVWRSLHERVLVATAQRYAAGLPPLSGEGQVQVSLAERLTPPGQAPDPNGELYVHEALVSWDGWSLSAPRAGLPLSRHPDAPDPARPETLPAAVPNDPQTAMGLSFSSTVVPGSLPRLRFGRSYRLRLREVDLVGGALTVGEADALAVGDVAAEPYLRFEPVAAPAAVPYAAFGEGASLHRWVIRSDVGVDPDGYAAALQRRVPGAPGVRAGRRAAPRAAEGELRPGREARAVRPGHGVGRHAAERGAGGDDRRRVRGGAAGEGQLRRPRRPRCAGGGHPDSGRRARRPVRPAHGRPARAALPARPARHRGDLLGVAGGAAG